MPKPWLITAAISGFMTVALGAFGAHALKDILDDYGRTIFEKAVIYQMFHTGALLAVSVFQMFKGERSFSPAGWSFVIGILFFSGSLYILAITGIKWFGLITPIGGIAFLIGWALMIYAASKTINQYL